MTGIGGVLGGLISDVTPKPKTEQARPAMPKNSVKRQPRHGRARTGRPPGKEVSNRCRKEKLTVRIDADLVESYRDWSWDARCNLGTLVGQAMRHYLGKRS